ncbi:FAD dependent oxidoreductase [Gallaecimonas pentaromativorans]|uniref:D-amino-acid oxidase n=1 Tax=Gallaecimonas pentaromativorans TaxID=584787 RepID=A0A3N1P6V2_9GAMM|nr:FAD dependent oxidoreductase [Gallaecimonas pentaromativorans]
MVGCGAIGITTAIEAQQAGFEVTIYAKAQLPQANSAFATGVWSPDSRIVAKAHGDALAPRWQQMARISFARYQALLGHSAKPVEWLPVYNLSSLPFDKANRHALPGEPDYPHWEAQLLNGLRPADQPLAPGASPFRQPHVRREQLLMFNLSQYGDWLLARFRAAGGRLLAAELSCEQDFARLGSQLVINCTGFGAKALLGDDALLPVRGQTCRLPPQLAVCYGIRDWDSGVSAYPRRDGVLVQTQAQGDFGAQHATVDLEESRQAVTQLAALMAGMRA